MGLWQTGDKVDFYKLEEYLEQYGYSKNELMREKSFYIPDETAYSYLCKHTYGHENIRAISFFGRHITYKQLLQQINYAANGLATLGLGNEDIVLVLLPNMPEAIYCQYALNKIGAVPDFADPRCNAKQLLQYVEAESISNIIIADVLYENTVRPVEKELREKYAINKIIVVPVINSAPQLLKLASKLKGGNKEITSSNIRVVAWEQIMSHSNPSIASVPYRKGKNAIIVHSSGTSSNVPKAICLTNENVNSFVEKHKLSEFNDVPVGSVALHILPFFAAYGSINLAHLGLCLGLHLIEIPELNFNDMGLLVAKYKPFLLIGVPSWFITIARDPRMIEKDLSFLKMVIAGGESVSEKDEKEINTFLKSHNAKCVLTKGHGMSELCGSASYSFTGHNKIGSVGTPFPFDKYIVLGENKQIVPLVDGEVTGEVYIYSPSACSGVFNGEVFAETTEINGFRFLATKDTMRITSENEIFFEERSDRSFTRFDGYKIRPANIENALMKNPTINDCMIVQFEDEIRHGKMPIAHLVVNQDMSREHKIRFIHELVDEMLVSDQFATRDIPTRWRFRSAIPLTKMQKKDYKTLVIEPLEHDDIIVNITESNLLIKEIAVE